MSTYWLEDAGRPKGGESSKAPVLERVGTPTVEAFRKKHLDNMRTANQQMAAQQKKHSSRGSNSRGAAHTRFDASAVASGVFSVHWPGSRKSFKIP